MVAAALAYDFGDDCGIYNVGTVEHGPAARAGHRADRRPGARRARPRLPDGERCSRREMAERVYAAVGFRDLGRILEFVP